MDQKDLHLKTKNWHPVYGTGPEADWRVLLVSAIILTIVTIIVNIFVFIKIDKGEIFVVKDFEDGEVRSLDVEKLKSTVSYYNNKALKFEGILNGIDRATVVDPSL